MKRPRRTTRRRFLGAAAAVAGAMLTPGARGLGAATPDGLAGVSSTDRFWYRLQPPGPYIDSQRRNMAFGYQDGTICLSEDNGRTWPHRAAFPDARHIQFSCILKDGTILFATGSKLYRSADRLKTFGPVTVKDARGADYIPQPAKDASRSGWYFHTLSGVNAWDVDGTEMLVWGNYCNVLGGPTPVNIYYSTDGGRTVKIAYAFGTHPARRDAPGDPQNPVVCRHVHSVAYNPAENAFYACTGDFDNPPECHWLRGTYDAKADRWQWKVIVTGPMNSRYKSGGINFVDGKLYWISDANGPLPHDRGIFCCDPADLADPQAHTRLYDPKVESGNMIIQDGVILSTHLAPASPLATGIIISLDLGKTWAEYDLKELGRRSPTRFHEKNGDGWFRMDLRTGWIMPDGVLFIKPKP
jgi:hypothetical protein